MHARRPGLSCRQIVKKPFDRPDLGQCRKGTTTQATGTKKPAPGGAGEKRLVEAG